MKWLSEERDINPFHGTTSDHWKFGMEPVVECNVGSYLTLDQNMVKTMIQKWLTDPLTKGAMFSVVTDWANFLEKILLSEHNVTYWSDIQAKIRTGEIFFSSQLACFAIASYFTLYPVWQSKLIMS
jgi:hypothetical protein